MEEGGCRLVIISRKNDGGKDGGKACIIPRKIGNRCHTFEGAWQIQEDHTVASFVPKAHDLNIMLSYSYPRIHTHVRASIYCTYDTKRHRSTVLVLKFEQLRHVPDDASWSRVHCGPRKATLRDSPTQTKGV
jgi:hypothetical protein